MVWATCSRLLSILEKGSSKLQLTWKSTCTFMLEVFRIATKKTDLASQNALETRPAVPGQVASRPDPAGGFVQQQQQQHNICDESLQILQAQQQRGSPEPSTAATLEGAIPHRHE